VLDFELSLHAEGSALLDCKWLALESLDGTWWPQIDDDVGAAFDFKTKGEDDAFARVVGIGDIGTLAKT
jgi:hypothetical protein